MRIAMLGVKGMPHAGGIESVVEHLGSRLARRGHEVTVYVRPHHTSLNLREYKGMKLISLPSIRTKHLEAITHTSLATFRAVSAGVDIAHIHSIGLSVLAPIPRARGIRTVVQSHGLDWQRAKWGKVAKTFLKLTDYSTVRLPDAAVAVSKKMTTYYREKFHREVHYIPNGVEKFTKVEPREMLRMGLREGEYILFASRLVPEKGCHYLIQAYSDMGDVSKKLVIAGDSNYGGRYASEIKKRASENLLFLGSVRGRLLAELMSNAFVYVQPSEVEGLSNSLLEAMSYGNCVVVSDIEENLEVVEDCGFSFRNGDCTDLKRILEYLLMNEEVVGETARVARKHVLGRYDWDCVTDQYEELYESLLR